MHSTKEELLARVRELEAVGTKSLNKVREVLVAFFK